MRGPAAAHLQVEMQHEGLITMGWDLSAFVLDFIYCPFHFLCL